MPISDDDLVTFYQRILVYLYCERDEDIDAIIPFPTDDEAETWFPNAVAALTRLTFSGLIAVGKSPEKTMNILANTTDIETWLYYDLCLTNSGRDFIKQFHLPEKAGNSLHTLIPGLREALSRVFDEHGVGFDMELPYKSCAGATHT